MRAELQKVWKLLLEVWNDFWEDEVMVRAAALAFYTALSFAPLMVLLLWISSLLGDEAQAGLITQIRELIGSQAGSMVGTVVENAERRPEIGKFSGIVGIGVLMFSATVVFASLQTTLNHIWDIEPRPGLGIWAWVRTRLLSLGLIISLGFLLMVSLFVSAAISMVLPRSGWLPQTANALVSIFVFGALFGMIFKMLPDAQIRWRYVVTGSLVTAVLFAVGKYLIGLYLGQTSVGSAYGTAGSLVVLLVWVYYTSIIVMIGAELTHAYAKVYGRGIRPERHAVNADDGSKRKKA